MIAELLVSIDLTTFLIFVAVASLTWIYFKNSNLPPGPWGVPLLGYLPFLALKGGDTEASLHDLAKKYGPVMSLKFGPTLMVVLDSYEAIKEAFVRQGDIFSGRPQDFTFKVKETDSGVFISEGDLWKEHRRFALSAFRDFGMGKNSLEPRIIEEITYLTEEIAKQNGKPYDFSNLIGMSTANVISTLEFGRRYEYTDKEFIEMRRLMNESAEVFESLPLRGFFPILTKFDVFEPLTKNKQILDLDQKFTDFVMSKVKEHRKSYTEGSRHDFIDAYLTEQKTMKEKTGSIGYFDENELDGNLQGFFAAGTETTSLTLRWAVLVLLIHPDTQKKVHQEIDDVIGLERVPTMADKNSMPYTDAFLLEVQRYASITPLGVLRRTLEETTLNGFKIPKHTSVIINQWAVHFDPTLWKNPQNFSPERFINEKGQVTKPDHLIPFGIGKRVCMGESLARMELFLYFTSLLQRFTFKSPEGAKPSLNNYDSKFARRPKLYEFCAIQREGFPSTSPMH